jgi:hypothetical protein
MAGEYLGDIEITDAFFQKLRNVNEHMTRINKVPRGRYAVYADSGNLILKLSVNADYDGDRGDTKHSSSNRRTDVRYPEKSTALATRSAKAGR